MSEKNGTHGERCQLSNAESYRVTLYLDTQRDRLVKLTLDELTAECRGKFDFPLTRRNVQGCLKTLGLRCRGSRSASALRSRLDDLSETVAAHEERLRKLHAVVAEMQSRLKAVENEVAPFRATGVR